MESSKTFSKNQAFVLTSKELQLINGLFPQASDVVIRITCKDGIERKYKSVEEFLDFENPPNKEITELFFMSLSQGAENTTTVHLRSALRSTSLVIICKGREDYVTTTLDRLEERFSSMTPWYALIARHSATLIMLVAQVPLVRLLIKSHSSSYTLSNLTSDIASTPLPQLFLVAIALVLYGIVVIVALNLLDRVRHYVFPMGVFSLGQGAKRHQNREILRLVVVIGFIINLAAGAVIWLFTSR